MRKSKKRLLSWVVTGVFLATTIIVPAGKFGKVSAKESNDKTTISYKQESKDVIANKISKTLKDEFTKNKKVTFLVKLKDQVDAKKVASEEMAKTSNKNLTAAKAELVNRSTIVSQLRIKSDTTQSSLKNYLNSEKAKGNVDTYHSYYIVNGMAVTATEDVMNEIAAMPEVESLKPNGKVQLVDSIKTNAKSIQATNNIEWNLDKIGVPAVWNLGLDGTGIVVANIDTGVQWDHPALKTKYRGYNPQDPNNPNNECNWYDATSTHSLVPVTYHAHGTHTMGTMVGSETNGTNKIGVAPGAKWIAVAALTADGGSDTDLIDAGEWILAPKDHNGTPHPEKAPNVVNNSWGGGPGVDDWYKQVVANWKAAGIFPEFSAGNVTRTNPGGPGSVANPANYPDSFSTGATDINNNLGDFSLRGPSPYGGILKPEISAPGVNIRSSVPGNAYEGGWDGTSMAGPHTCGLVALLLQANRNLTVTQLEDVIKNTATPRTDSEYPTTPNNGYGYGVINALNAVSSIRTGIGEVKGSVLRDGADTNPPTFKHTPVTELYVGTQVTLNVEAIDDVSVSKVELQYKSNVGDQWTTVAAEAKSGDYKDGTYEATIPGSKVIVPILVYRWKITDFGKNEVTSENYLVNVKPGLTAGYVNDFESGLNGLTITGTPSWVVGTPTVGPGKAFSGSNVLATNLSGSYAANTDTTVTTPPIEVPATGSLFLQYKQWFDSENSYDKGTVKISQNGTTWETVKTYTGTLNTTSNYSSEQINLSSYAGKRIFVAFNFKSDNSINKTGWFIDDLKLSSVSASSRRAMITDAVKVNRTNKIESTASGLPVAGTVTVLETGRATATNPADGTYSINHPSGDFTFKAEAYGFYPETKQVHVVKDGVINQNFNLAPIPKGTISGKIINTQTGNPVKGAKIYLLEDAAVAPAVTDDNGNYSISPYEGNYTVQVTAQDYYSEQFEVTVTGNSTITKDLQLKPFIGYKNEIGYDDGTPENALAFKAAGNGFAVRMSLPEGKKATVSAGLFKFWDAEWPVPGGTSFKVAIFDASGENGAPGKKLAGPIDATAIRDKNQWTKVDLSGAGVVVSGDFYMVYIQDAVSANAPGIAMDEKGPNAKRTWEYVSGGFKLADESEGNCMIRTIVSYEAKAPVITSPVNNSYTTNANVTVKGTASPELDLHLLNNNQEVAVGRTDAAGNFAFNIKLNNGANVLKAYTSASNGVTDPSAEVKVTLDTEKPILSIKSPANNSRTNKDVITITGLVSDENLDFVKVNGSKAKVSEDGSWSIKMIVEDGINTFKVVAQDKAGNKVTKTIKVDAKLEIQEISNLNPATDVNLTSGKSVKIEFDSEPGLKKAVFMLHASLINTSNSIARANGITSSDSVIELPMMEVEDEDGNGTGHYVGYYTATSNLVASGVQIEVKVTDWYGNVLTKMAQGKLNINAQ